MPKAVGPISSIDQLDGPKLNTIINKPRAASLRRGEKKKKKKKKVRLIEEP